MRWFSGQKQVYLTKNPVDANLTEDDLQRIVTKNGPEFKALLGRMQKFNLNITVSNTYFYKRHVELEALMQQKWMCTMWFTLSAADNQWINFHRLIFENEEFPIFDDVMEEARYKRKLALQYPHIVDAYFYKRVKIFIKSCFGKNGL